MKRVPELLLHIGTEKTGTTSIQSFLAGNRRELGRQSIVVPRTPGLLSHHRVAAYGADEGAWGDLARPARLTSARARRRFLREFPSTLRAEIARSVARRVILSSEHCHSRVVTIGEIERVRELLEPLAEQVRILVYFRRQDQMAVSAYASDLKYGAVRDPLQAHLDTISADDPFYSLQRIYERWASVFGVDRLSVRMFSPENFIGGSLIRDFAASAGIELTSRLVIPRRRNVGLDRLGVEFLRRFNERAPRVTAGRAHRRRSDLVGVLEEYHGGQCLPPRATALRLYRRFEGSNDRLRRCLGVRQLFSEDFSAYPEYQPEAEVSERLLSETERRVWREVARRRRMRTIRGRILRVLGIVREPSQALNWLRRWL